ncbi:MAG: PKD domain-containing protein [Flavobacteriaceae bacterium]
MKNLIKTLKKVSLLILAISFIGCDDDEAVLPQLTAGFTYTINASTGTVTFINTSINASMYDWDFGDESTSNLINPVNVYENGTYLVVLRSSNVAGAFDIFTDEITINVAEVVGTCDAETAESLSASDFNMTFMSDPTADITSDGAGFSWIDNPDFENDVNTSCKVGQIDRTSAAQYANNQLDLDAKLDFNSNTGFKLKVWSPTASTAVLLKLEDKTDSSIFKEVSATTSAESAGAWEEISFDFESADSNKFDKIVVFFELGTSTEQTYYIDDLMLYGEGNGNGGGGGGGGGACTPETTESYSAANVNMTFQTDPSADFISDGAGFSWVDNPDFDNAVNTSCKVGQVVRGNNNPWDNNQYDLDAKLDFNANTGFKIKVWSARPNTEVRLKLEEIGNAGNNTEQFLTTSVTSGWEELTFPFTAADSNKFNKIVLFFDLNTTSTDTYYFDDLRLYGNGNSGGGGGGGGGGGTGSYNLTLPIDFETSGHGANWTWNVFENDSNPPLEFVANPNASGINNSATVAKITALQTGNPWAGTETAHGEMGITWDLSASNAIIKVMVYKTVISDVGVKLVNPSGGAQVEIKVANTVVNAWEELTFDFTSRIGNGLDGSTNIDQIVVFPDFDLGGRSADNVIYFDNITFQ